MAKKAVEDIAAQVEENYEKEEIEEVGGVVEFTSFGSDIFDCIGGGGAPFGKVINIIGDNSVGKSLVASEIVAHARKKYGKDLVWYYDDSEAGYSFDSMALWGFEIITEDMTPSDTIEEFSLHVDRALAKLKKGQKLIYIVDSFDGLSSMQELEEFEAKMVAIEKDKKIAGSFGMSKGKGTNQFFRVMANKIKDKDCLLVIISQVRENIGAGMFEPKYRRNGGKSLDLYACQIYWLAVSEKYKKKDTVVGVCAKIKNTKNKVGKPYREGYMDLLFDYGVDNVSSNIKYLYDLKTDGGKDAGKTAAKNLEWDGTSYQIDELIKHIESNGLERMLTRKVKQKWAEFEKSIATDRKRRHE